MARVSRTSCPVVQSTYKDDSFGGSCSTRCAVGLTGGNFETHVDVSRVSLSPVIILKLLADVKLVLGCYSSYDMPGLLPQRKHDQ